jgi:hypothetical protein
VLQTTFSSLTGLQPALLHITTTSRISTDLYPVPEVATKERGHHGATSRGPVHRPRKKNVTACGLDRNNEKTISYDHIVIGDRRVAGTSHYHPGSNRPHLTLRDPHDVSRGKKFIDGGHRSNTASAAML